MQRSAAPYRPPLIRRPSAAGNTNGTPGRCPFLGTPADPGTSLAFPSEANHCFRSRFPIPISSIHQENYCLSLQYESCPVYRQFMTENEATAAPVRAEHHRRAVAAHYQLLREAKTVREKLAVWQALVKLIGLNAPDELVVTWRDEVIDLLRNGAVAPEVVEAELGDELATELFNAAGVARA